MHPEISRRSFLIGSAGLAALAACGGEDKPDVSVDRPTTTAKGSGGPLSVLVGTFGAVAGVEERIAFAVLEGTPPKPLADTDAEITVSFAKVDGQAGPPEKATPHHEGIEERPYWSVRRTFAEPGNYVLEVNYEGRKGQAGLKLLAADAATSPAPGKVFPAIVSPTVSDPKGVNPVCTRKPPCPLHGKSIDAALREKKPAIVLFSTPALCQSAICGPVLDILLDAEPQWKDKANAIHVEVFTDLTGQKATEAFSALKSTVEPLIYFVKADGTIADRFDGPVDKVEMREAIARLFV